MKHFECCNSEETIAPICLSEKPCYTTNQVLMVSVQLAKPILIFMTCRFMIRKSCSTIHLYTRNSFFIIRLSVLTSFRRSL